MKSEDLIIVGAGGLGTEFAWVAGEMAPQTLPGGIARQWRVVGFADDSSEKKGTNCSAWPVLGTIEEAAAGCRGAVVHFAVAVGDNAARERLAARAQAVGWLPATLIHRSVITAPDATIGEGSYIAPGCVICPQARVGNHVIVNTHVSVGHHVVLGDFSQICPGARISGGCTIGRLAFLGSNASIGPRLTVGDAAAVGANSHAVRSVPAGITVVGCPAIAMGASRLRAPAKQGDTGGGHSNG